MKILWKVKKMNNTDYHIPVMKHEAVSHLLSDRDGIYICLLYTSDAADE